MANTYASLFYHVVFSTKNREFCIAQDIEERVWSYIGGVARKHKMTAIKVGGIEDHIHALVLAPPKFAPAAIAQYLKGDSSKWIHDELLGRKWPGWQDGYAAFSVSKSNVPAVEQYIVNQRQHHEKESFESEYRRLMQLHEIDFDEKYLLG